MPVRRQPIIWANGLKLFGPLGINFSHNWIKRKDIWKYRLLNGDQCASAWIQFQMHFMYAYIAISKKQVLHIVIHDQSVNVDFSMLGDEQAIV